MFLFGLLKPEPAYCPDFEVVHESPQNVVLIIGDGMGLSAISAALYQNFNKLNLEFLPVVGMVKCHSADNIITDSAAGATAFASGKKTKNNVLGLDAYGTPVKTIIDYAKLHHHKCGLITTSSIVHATPAAFLAHQPNRFLYDNVAFDITQEPIDLLIGGGRKFFNEIGDKGKSYLSMLKSAGYKILHWDQHQLHKISRESAERLVFFTAENQPPRKKAGRKYLPEACKVGLDFLSKDDRGFFLMIEGGQIDMAAHQKNGEEVVQEIQDLDKAIAQVLRFYIKNPNTLIIITADHETGGLALNDGKINDVELAFTTNGHTASMVPLFAIGPQSHLFHGIYDNTEIFKKIMQAKGWEEMK